MWPLLPEGPWVFHYSHCKIRKRCDRVKPQFDCIVNLFLAHHLKTCTPIFACVPDKLTVLPTMHIYCFLFAWMGGG